MNTRPASSNCCLRYRLIQVVGGRIGTRQKQFEDEVLIVHLDVIARRDGMGEERGKRSWTKQFEVV